MATMTLRYKLRNSFILCLLLLFSACTTQRQMSYLRDVGTSSAVEVNEHFQAQREAHIVCGDALLITVSSSSMDVDAVRVFNLPLVNAQNLASDKITTQQTLQYYTVDKDGNIFFPILGQLHVESLTTSELRQMLTEKISAYVQTPIVNIQYLNFSISVTGEVTRPGKYQIQGERVTIFDALALAGDMTVYGKRQNVLISREKEGKMEFARLNLNSEDIFSSPYYYLQQNDVVYVEPNHVRAVASQNLPLYLSALSTLGSMATVIVTVVNFSQSHSR